MIKRIFETHIPVQNLERSVDFYAELPGLELGTIDPARRIAFFWIGGRNVSMLGLWEKPSAEILRHHFAFEIAPADMDQAVSLLKKKRIKLYNFWDDGTERPMVFGWMPAASIYFSDPDGHELELIAPLPEAPRPEIGIVSLEQWRAACAR